VTWSGLLSLGLFQVVWLACAMGAARGLSWPGIIAAAVLVAFHVASAARRWSAVGIVIAAGALGLAAESLLVVSGLVRYAAPWPIETLAPAWIVALWLAFGTALETTRRVMGSNPIAASSLLGLTLGPLSYVAGERLGALGFPEPAWPSLLAIAVVWGIACPALVAIDGAWSPARNASGLR
jgi:hypothetical protein